MMVTLTMAAPSWDQLSQDTCPDGHADSGSPFRGSAGLTACPAVLSLPDAAAICPAWPCPLVLTPAWQFLLSHFLGVWWDHFSYSWQHSLCAEFQRECLIRDPSLFLYNLESPIPPTPGLSLSVSVSPNPIPHSENFQQRKVTIKPLPSLYNRTTCPGSHYPPL